jgi:hypothetical protein
MSAALAAPRLDIDPERAGQDIARLALAIAELLRQLMERQAVRRMESGALDEGQQERVGLGLMNARAAILDVADKFGIAEADLNLDLGPLGRLL